MEKVTILINRFDKLQKSLSPEFKTDATLHDIIISACINIEACKMECYRPSPIVSGLIHDLKSGIKIFNKSLPSSSVLLAQSTSQLINQNTFFTNHAGYAKRKDDRMTNTLKALEMNIEEIFFSKLEKGADGYITNIEVKHDDYKSDEIDLQAL
ncbi:hypothetical protein GcM3_187039, partial [Golovinomyces cichoracearum]